jgi:hypothetical protein
MKMVLKLTMLIILLSFFDCRYHGCEEIGNSNRCMNNPLCKWFRIEEDHDFLGERKKEGECTTFGCQGRDQNTCDLSVCRWNNACLSCNSINLQADCTGLGCCWYNGKCHNSWKDECIDYTTQSDCENNDSEEGYCYWNTNDKSCYANAASCAEYSIKDECTNKITLVGDRCYYYRVGVNTYVCSDVFQSACSDYYDSDSCDGNYNNSGNLCYWSGSCLTQTQGTDCTTYGTDNIGCAVGYPGNICYPLYSGSSWSCSNTRTGNGNCGYYKSAEFCKYGTSIGGNCYWIEATSTCVDSLVADCSDYTSATDCRGLTTDNGDSCYWYTASGDVSPSCNDEPLECDEYSVADCTKYNVNVYGGACYLYEGRCNAVQQECETYINSGDCAVGSPYGKCYWYANSCHDSLENSCSRYGNKPDCVLGTSGNEDCYWYNGSCNKLRAPCNVYTDQDQCVRGTFGGQCWWYDPSGGVNPSCHPVKQPFCALGP